MLNFRGLGFLLTYAGEDAHDKEGVAHWHDGLGQRCENLPRKEDEECGFIRTAKQQGERTHFGRLIVFLPNSRERGRILCV
jgi:hypothetical protein